MALSSYLTPFEKRTATLLTIIGVLGSLLGIIAIATPYFFVMLTAAGLCDDACGDMRVRNAQVTHIYYTTAGIMLLSIIVSFLPRIIYGVRLRKARQEHERTRRGN